MTARYVNRIRSERLSQGLSMRQLSAISGVSYTRLSEIETGVRCATPEQLDTLSAVLCREPGELLGPDPTIEVIAGGRPYTTNSPRRTGRPRDPFAASYRAEGSTPRLVSNPKKGGEDR